MFNADFVTTQKVTSMYFDYFVLGFIALGIGDLFFNWTGDSDTENGEDETPEPEIPDGESDEYVAGVTTITVETDGETATTTFDDVDFGVAPTVSGTELRDIIAASDDTGLEMNLDGGAGDDSISFGFGASVTPGEGDDIMDLSVTRNALASESEFGVIDLTDADDALSVNFEDETPEFVHTVRGQTIETIDGTEVRTEWVDYYVSDSAELSRADLIDDNTYDAQSATRVFRAIIGQGAATGTIDINADPAITLNRTIASAANLDDG